LLTITCEENLSRRILWLEKESSFQDYKSHLSNNVAILMVSP
jgi:hypothetical protein